MLALFDDIRDQNHFFDLLQFPRSHLRVLINVISTLFGQLDFFVKLINDLKNYHDYNYINNRFRQEEQKDEVVLGAVPMEDMDLLVLPAHKTVIVNPNSPNFPQALVK
jgi:hypothetical protein